MGKDRPTRRLCLLPLALLLVALLPTVARAETRTFLSTTQLFPSGGALTEGPANVYPSRILVSGLSGTVTKATVTVIGYGSGSPDDADMAITGPNGAKVMLMSDVCGENPDTVQDENWTFDDSAPTFLSNNGPCAPGQSTSFKPSNYLGAAPEPDDLSQGGGPAPPYLNALSFFNGASPNGAWDLFVLDDNPAFNGFGIPGWALTLTVQSPPTQPPAPESDFTIGKLEGKTLSLNVTSAGAVEVTDARATRASRTSAAAKKRLKRSTASGGPGTIEVKLRLTRAAKKQVSKKGKVKVNARITFTPDGGTPDSQTEKLKIRKR